jgi:hypothetical protein
MTNNSNCELTAQSIRVTLRDATYQDGSQKTFGTTESESISQSVSPGKASLFSYAFTQYFDLKPVKMSLVIVVTFSGAGDMTVYDGDVTIPAG